MDKIVRECAALRQRAAELRQQAKNASGVGDPKMLLLVADEYEKLAKHIEAELGPKHPRSN